MIVTVKHGNFTTTAIQWTGDNLAEVKEFCGPLNVDRLPEISAGVGAGRLYMRAFKRQWCVVVQKDWIIKAILLGELQRFSDAAFKDFFTVVQGTPQVEFRSDTKTLPAVHEQSTSTPAQRAEYKKAQDARVEEFLANGGEIKKV